LQDEQPLSLHMTKPDNPTCELTDAEKRDHTSDDRPDRNTVAMKVVGIFGSDTMTLVPVSVEQARV
jgi:hypothetical protein